MIKETRFKEAIDANKDKIYRICCCYVRDNDTRKDVYQEILVHIWKSIDSFEGKSEISTWIYRITVNTCLGHVRSEKRRTNLFQDQHHHDTDLIGQTPVQDTTTNESNIENLYECINQLPPLEKTLVSLYLEDVSTSEMAEILGISESNVRVKLHRIKKNLKEIWEKNNNELG